MADFMKAHRRLIVPEVVQTSAMDCGPASLKCLLEGFGISASYGRLREACQTDVDGTSIDTMEEVAVQLGLEAEQIMVPIDHVLLPEAQTLPAIVVTRQANGFLHFIVAWCRYGRFVQVMDPATGRRWPTCKRFLDELYVHTIPVQAAAWREWTSSDKFLRVLRRRLANLELSRLAAEELINTALADPGWYSFAALDASTRMTDALVRAGGPHHGSQAARVLKAFFERARKEAPDKGWIIPPAYWLVWPVLPGPDGEEQLLLRGVVLVRVRGRRPADQHILVDGASEGVDRPPPLSPELVAALKEPPSRPGRELIRLLRLDGLLTPGALVFALALAAGTVIFEALMFRVFLDLGRELGLTVQRLVAIGMLLIFMVLLLFLELPITASVLRLGRRLEVRLRMAFLEKIPRLGDRYFRSRLTSDMAERSHVIHGVRSLPGLGTGLIQSIFELTLTTAGIIWLDPASAPIAVLVAVLSVGLPLTVQPLLTERNLRILTHSGALSRFYLDALLGVIAVRAHRAERAVRREHESLLVEWARANIGLLRMVVPVGGVLSLVSLALVVWLVFSHIMRGDKAGEMLLFIYWALNLPALGQGIAQVAWQYPSHRNMTLRLLEPLGAPEEADVQESYRDGASSLSDSPQKPSRGVAIVMEGVSVRAAGHTILEGIDLTIKAGSHVAIVGPSGAGKSSLVGILLGWHKPATGQVLIDGEPLDDRQLEKLRQETAWVDPAVQLWNRSFLDNLLYGVPATSSLPVGRAIEQGDLYGILKKLPDGLQTLLGEGGALVSGGEGQRVRLGRAMLRPGVRLVILDEPFRGLDRNQRRELLTRARKLWCDATLLCVIHDINETLMFERVLVIEGGRIVEDSTPSGLAEQPNSRYQAMLEAEEAVREGLWSSGAWRRLWLEGGRLFEKDWRKQLVEKSRKEEV